MTWQHAHLLMNHVPVIGTVIAVATFIIATLVRSREAQRAALWIALLVALSAGPAYLSGSQAEDLVEKLPGVARSAIHQHEESALQSLITVGVLGVLAAAGLLASRRGRRLPAWIATVTILVGLASAVLFGVTANLGGRIHRPELRGAAVAEPPGAAGEPGER
jgi:uncharacterized membrane protein